MHDLEHQWSRRDALRLAGLFGLGALLPRGLTAADSPTESSPLAVNWDRQLVLIELDGGNDGLNTFIPVDNDLYYTARESQGLGIGKSLALSLTGIADHRLHPRLSNVRTMYNDGDVAIIQSVGYADSNRSHFRGIDIWNTGADTNTFLDDGWLSRILAGTTIPNTVVAEGTLHRRSTSNPIEGSNRNVLAMATAEDFVDEASDLLAIEDEEWAAAADSNELTYLLNVHERIRTTAGAFRNQLTDGDPDNYTPPSYNVDFPDTGLGRQLRSICDIIVSGLRIPIHKASYSGFDTHAGQVDRSNVTTGTHANLLGELDEALHAFRAALRQHNKWNNTLIMTYSEFGRRLFANASRGTDHGAASCHFMLGGGINGGLYGNALDLREESLVRGDPAASTDYRRLYATAASFMGMDASLAFPDVTYSPLAILPT